MLLLHQHGVNVRLLGELWRIAESDAMKRFLMHEVLARALKRHWSSCVESVGSEEELSGTTAAWLNQVFGRQEQWCDLCANHLRSMFGYALILVASILQQQTFFNPPPGLRE